MAESEREGDVVEGASAGQSGRAKARSAAVIPASNPFLQLFWQLAEESPQQRQQAQESLLAALQAEQTQAQQPPASSSVAPNLLYAVKRLLRGLCSSRGRAREGFGSALVAVLTAFPALPSDVLRSALAASTSPPSAPSRQELTDFKLGYAQAVRCLCAAGRAELWADEGEEATLHVLRRLLGYANSSKAVREAAYCAVQELIAAVSWDEYQQRLEPAVLADMATVKREASETENGQDDGQNKQGRGGAEGHEQQEQRKRKKARREQAAEDETPLIELHQLTAEQFALLLSMQSLYEQHSRPLHSLASHFAPSALSPLSPSNLPTLLELLSSTSYSLPALHSAYAQTFSRLLSFPSSSDWSSLYSLLAAYLFAERASTARKHQGLLLLQHLLGLLPGSPLLASAAAVSCLLHPLLLRSLSNLLSSPSTHLHDEAKAVQAALLRAAQAERSIALPVLDRLLGSNARWDAVTKSRTVQRLVQLLSKDDLHAHIAALIRSFTAEQDGQPAAGAAAEEREKRQLWCLERLCDATRHSALLDPSAAVDSAATETVLGFLVFHSFVDASQPLSAARRAKGKGRKKAARGVEAEKAAVPGSRQLASPLSQRVRAVCQTRLWSLLDDLLPRPPVKLRPEEQKRRQKEEKRRKRASARVDARTEQEEAVETETDGKEEPRLWAMKAHEHLSHMERDGHALVRPLTEDGREARQAMLQAVQKMEQRRAEVKARLAAQTDQQEVKKARERLKKERALSVLMLHLGLLQLAEEGSMTPLLQELQLGHQQLFSQRAAAADDSGAVQPSGTARARGGKRRAAPAVEAKDGAEAAPPQPAFIDTIVDILLSLLVRRSSLVRSVARLTFVAFASDVSEAALQDVLRVVKTKAGGSEKKEGEGDDDLEPFDVDDDAEDGDAEKAEVQAGKEGAQVGSSARSKRKRDAVDAEQQQAGSDESSDVDSSDDESVALESLDGLLSAPLTAAEQAAVDAASPSMEQYDHQLSNILRLRQAGRKEQQEDLQAQQLDFQLRVMDLLEVFVRSEARSRLLLQPMLEAVADAVAVTSRAEKLKGLHERLVALMHRMTRSKEHPTVIFPFEKREDEAAARKRRKGKRKAQEALPVEQEADEGRYAVTVSRLQQLMTALMGRAQRAADSETLALLSACLLWLVRISLPPAALLSPASQASLPAAVRSHLSFTHALYSSALNSYLSTRHSRLNTRFFTDFVSAAPAIAWLSAPAIAALAVSGAATAFLRCDCFTFLSQLMGRKEMLSEDGQQPLMAEVTRCVAEALEAMLRYAGMTEEERAKAKEEERRQKLQSQQQREEEGEREEAKTAAADPSQLSKAERVKLKQKEKKRRRREREKQQRQRAAASSSPAATAATSSQSEHRAVIHRLKTALKAATAVAAQSRRLSLGVKLLTPHVLQAMRGLQQADVAELRGAMHNLLIVGGEEDLDVMKAAKAADEEGRKRKAEAKRRQQQQAQKAASRADRSKEATLQPLSAHSGRRQTERKEKELKEKAVKEKGDAAVKREEEKEGAGGEHREAEAGRAGARKPQRPAALEDEQKSGPPATATTATSGRTATAQATRRGEKEERSETLRAGVAARPAVNTKTARSAATGQKRKRDVPTDAAMQQDAAAATAGRATAGMRKREREIPTERRREAAAAAGGRAGGRAA